MTYSNGSFNPNPLANPFNTRLGPSNYSLNPAGDSYRLNMFRADRNARLPEPSEYVLLELHIPDTTPLRSFSQLQFDIDQYSRDKTWNNSSLYADILNNTLDCNQGLSRKDIDYWNKANSESLKLSANITQELKQMLADIEKMFPKSKFEDD